MEDTQIRDFIAQIAESNSDDLKSNIQKGHPPRMLFVTANRAALLGFASVFLEAAVSPIKDETSASRAVTLGKNHEQIADNPKKDFLFGFVRRFEAWPERADIIAARKARAWKNDRVALFGCGVVTLIVLFFLVSGFTYWLSIIFGK